MKTTKTNTSDTSISEETIILHLLKELDQTERNILGLYFYEKLTPATISELIQISEKQVKSYLSNILRKIKGELKGDHQPHVREKQAKKKQIWKGEISPVQNLTLHDR